MKKIKLFYCVVLSFVFICTFIFMVSANGEAMLLGDADNNGTVDASDALMILKVAAGLEDMGSDFSIRKNDFDYDYNIDARDALGVLKIAASLEDKVVINDPQNFYSTIGYINGYPEHDYISCNLDLNKQYSIEEGINVKLGDSLTGVYLEEYENGEKLNNAVRLGPDHTNFDKVYWELRWLIEDVKQNNKVEKIEKALEFKKSFVKDNGFNGIHYEVYTITEFLKNVHSSVFVYITEDNEMYFYVVRRCDLYSSTDDNVYKYTGVIPENLTYESIAGLFNENLE